MRRLLLFLIPVAAFGSTIARTTLAERVGLADRVALVQVLEQRTVVENDDPRRMKTVVKLAVGENLKGQGEPEITVVQIGGKWGLWESHVPGDAVFQQGETAIVFLSCRLEGRCHLVGLAQGKLPVVGNDVLVHDLGNNEVSRRPVAEVLKELKAAAGGAK